MECFYSGTCAVIFIKDWNTAYISVRHNAAAPQNNVPSESSFTTKSALFGPKNVCPFQILDLTLWYDCVIYDQDPAWQWGVMARTWFWVCVHLDLGDITLGQGHGIPLGHGQQLCKILSRSNKTVRSYGPDTDFGYVWTVTSTLEI